MGFFVFLLYIFVIVILAKFSSLSSQMKELDKKLDTLNSKLTRLKSNYLKQFSYKAPKTEDTSSEQTSAENPIENNAIQEKHSYIQESKPKSIFSADENDDDDEWSDNGKSKNISVNEKSQVSSKRSSVQNKADSSFEDLFLGNVYLIVGAFAVIIASGIFITLIYQLITPLLKTIIGFIVGTSMIFGSKSIKKESLRKYSEVLMGTGYSILFITVYCTTVLFKTFSMPVCITIGCLLLIASYYTANKQKTSSMIAIALTGGYLNVWLVSGHVSYEFTFGYLIFLNLLTLIYVYNNPEKAQINVINLLITAACLLTGYLVNIGANNDYTINILYPLTLWFIYLVYDILRIGKNLKTSDNTSLLSWTNFIILTILSILIFKYAYVKTGILLAGICCVYGGLFFYFAGQKVEGYKTYLYSMLVTLLLATFFITEDIARVTVISCETVLLACLLQKYKQINLYNWILGYASSATILMFLLPNTFLPIESGYIPLFNMRLLHFLPPLAAFYLSYLVLKDTEVKNISSLKFSAISLLYIFISLEINDFCINYLSDFNLDINYVKCFLYLMVGFTYSLRLGLLARTEKSYVFKFISLSMYVICLCILVIAGLTYTNTENIIPIVNTRCLASIWAIIVSLIFKNWYGEKTFKYVALVVGFFLLHFEATNIVTQDTNYLISIIWLLYTGIIITYGIFKNDEVCRKTGICLSMLTLGRIVLYDLEKVDILFKLFIFLVLGSVLLITSYYYNKNKD